MIPAKTIKIIIADDHEFFRCGFKRIIGHRYKDQIEFIAEASNGIELVEEVKKHRPDIVITDIMMPEMDGIQACKIIRENYPKTGVIALSIFDQENYILDMLNAGAAGYLVKSSSKEEVLEAVSTVKKGMPYYCSTISDILYGVPESSANKIKKISFSFQEIKIMKLICKQLTTKEIANMLELSARTIEDYRHDIQEKIGARNVVGVALYAVINQIVNMSEL